MIWRSSVRNPIGLKLGCVVLLSKVVLEPNKSHQASHIKTRIWHIKNVLCIFTKGTLVPKVLAKSVHNIVTRRHLCRFYCDVTFRHLMPPLDTQFIVRVCCINLVLVRVY